MSDTARPCGCFGLQLCSDHALVALRAKLVTPCAFAAPLVVNGMSFVGCQLDKGHDGHHKVEITWGES